MENEAIINIIGVLAGIMTTISFVPQVVKVIKEKQAKDISLTMYIIFNLGITCWLVYGILLSAMPIILANSITLLLSMTVLILKIKYK